MTEFEKRDPKQADDTWSGQGRERPDGSEAVDVVEGEVGSARLREPRQIEDEERTSDSRP
jgi:hypothetical protein